MAENSCDNNSAPVEFDCTALIESSRALTVAVERCPLCSEAKRPFYCTNCVQNGHFYHSKATYPESYTDKLRRWDNLKHEHSCGLERFKVRIKPTHRKEQKKASIEECKRKIELLKFALAAARDKMLTEKKELEQSRKLNYLRTGKGRKHREKKRRICEYIEKVKCAINKKGEILDQKQLELVSERQKHVHHLTTYIFDVEEVKSRSATEPMALSDEVQEALKEASHTAYVRGRWVYSDSQYRIVAPTLPCFGDYSQYNTWVATNKENHGTEVASTDHNPGFNISAGLCYTSQLVSIMAHILSVTLPKQQCYSDFCVNDMSEKQFNHAVSRLNQNVLYLCFSQGVSPDYLEPKHTLQNMVALLSHPHLGRVGVFDVDPDMMQSVEDGTQSEESEEEPVGNNDDIDLATDWERVPLEIPEVNADCRNDNSCTVSSMQTMAYQSQRMTESTLTASNYVTSAAASVLSFFRGGTGQTDKR